MSEINFDRKVPEKGDEVRLKYVGDRTLNSGGVYKKGDIYAKGEVSEVHRFSDEEDERLSFYIEFKKEENNKVMYKFGYTEGGEKYSWVRIANFGGPEVELAEDNGRHCFEYEIL